MIQAILDGRKTMTRRTAKLTRVNNYPDEWAYQYWAGSPFKEHKSDNAAGVDSPRHDFVHKSGGGVLSIKCPYGIPGDRLWVREKIEYFDRGNSDNGFDGRLRYVADQKEISWPSVDGSPKIAASIHMPRAAARILLEITDVRVERLQDITPEDCLKEGINHPNTLLVRTAFADLWASINGADSWRQNPWVWVLSFKLLSK